MRRLDVHLQGLLVAHLDDTRSGLRLSYTAEALDQFGGWPLISVSMPVNRSSYRGSAVNAFFEGLLPEGEIRQMIAYDFSVPVDDTVGILEVLGADCAGALIIVPGETAPPTVGIATPIDEAAIAERIRRLPQEPLGVDSQVRLSLAGMHHKLLLTRAATGWALPTYGVPSTHIIKPAIPFMGNSIQNEALSMRIASHLGIDTATVEFARFEEVDALIVTRYDRNQTSEGIERIHQEDLCQALAIAPRRKYQSSGGPSLSACASVLRRWVHEPEVLLDLLDRVLLNVVLGNADAHGKNISLLHHRSGRLCLAPAYDLTATTFYPNTTRELAMTIGDVKLINEVTVETLIHEAASWGLDGNLAARRVSAVLEKLASALDSAASELGSPPALVDFLASRFATVRDRY